MAAEARLICAAAFYNYLESERKAHVESLRFRTGSRLVF